MQSKLVEKGLGKSNEDYWELFDNALDVIVTFDLKGKIVNINKAIKEYGFTRDEIISKNILEFISKKYMSTVLADLVKLRRGEFVTSEVEILTPKGNKIVEYRSNPMRIGEKIIGAQAILRDITERRQLEKSLKESEERFRAIFEGAKDGILVADMQTKKFIFGNDMMCRMLDSRKEEIKNLGVAEIHPKKDVPFVLDQFEKLAKREIKVANNIPVKMRDGRVFYADIAPSFFRLAGKTYMAGFFRDITERKQVEEALGESEEKYRTQFEEAMDAIFLADAETGIIIDCNRAATKLVDREKLELIGKHQRILHPSEQIEEEFSRTFKQHLKEKMGQILETQVITKNGEIKDVAIKANVFKLGDKKIIQGLFRDITDRKRMEEELTHERDLLQVLMDNVPDRIYFKDANSCFTRVNRASAERMGFKNPAEAIGKTDFDFYRPEFARETYEDEQKIIKRGKPLINKIEKSTEKTGRIRWSSVTKMPIKDKDGHVVGIVGISRDITTFKQMEEELTHERDLLQALMDNIPDLIYYKDPSSKFTRINKAHTAFLGLKDSKEAVGKTDFDFFTPEHSKDAYKDEQEIVKTGIPVINKVEKIRRADGQFRWVSATKVPIKDQNSQVTGLVGISRDITERKQIEEKMEYERDLFNALMDNMPDAIYFKDVESRFIRVSRISCPGLGIKRPEEAVGMTDFDFAPEELAKQFYADDQMVMNSGKPIIGKEEVMVSKVGKTWYSATKVPIRNKEGKVIGLVGISRDISKIKEVEEELKLYSDHLEELVMEKTKQLKQAEHLATIGETAAMVGHDLRNPLQGIINILYLMKQMHENAPPSFEVKSGTINFDHMLGALEQQVEYMNKIVSDLQDYARPLQLELMMTNLSNLVNEALSAINVPENINVIVKIENRITLILDCMLIKRVFTNLILNAIQAMPNGGELTIKSVINNDNVTISFQDTGIGIPIENMPKLFKPLFTTKSKGQGFGLAVCKRIIEAHNGSIIVCSEVNKGSIFSVNIPQKQEYGSTHSE
jgi:PAS domain S-box-containing protein